MTDLADILRVYQGSNGDATKALYAELEKLGPVGRVAVNLFRACKCSERAKVYRRGRGYKTAAYDRKDWSIRNLARVLHVNHAQMWKDLHPSGGDNLRWGWAVDEPLRERGDPHHHVLYIDLPTGQVSFHTGSRVEGPDYPGQWDGQPGQSADRICRWIGRLFQQQQQESAA